MQYTDQNPYEFRAVKTTEEFDDVLKWFYEATGSRNIIELADCLGTAPAQITDARRRLRVPEAWFRIGLQPKACASPRATA